MKKLDKNKKGEEEKKEVPLPAPFFQFSLPQWEKDDSRSSFVLYLFLLFFTTLEEVSRREQKLMEVLGYFLAEASSDN